VADRCYEFLHRAAACLLRCRTEQFPCRHSCVLRCLVLPDGSRVVVTELSTNVIALAADLGRRPALTRFRPCACLVFGFRPRGPSRSS